MRQVGYLQRLYRDAARSAEPKVVILSSNALRQNIKYSQLNGRWTLNVDPVVRKIGDVKTFTHFISDND